MRMSPNKRRPVYALALLLVAVSWVAPVTRAQGALDFRSSLLGPLSKRQVQGVQELAEEYGARDVRVYWVTTDSDKPQAKTYATDEQLRAFASKAGLKATVLRDPDGALFKKKGADHLPAVVIPDRHGAVSVPVVGGHDPKRTLVESLSGRLNKMLA